MEALLEKMNTRSIDFDRVNGGTTRLSVGAVDVESGNFVYFDNGQPQRGIGLVAMGRFWLGPMAVKHRGDQDAAEKLEKAADAHVAQRDAIIRLEEQVKHLTALIERLDDRIAIAPYATRAA